MLPIWILEERRGEKGMREKMNKGTEEKNIFVFTDEQQEIVCSHFGKKKEEMEEWEICELLDEVIDNLD